MVEEKSDIAKAWAVLARSLQIILPIHAKPIGSDEVIGHISQEVLSNVGRMEISYEDNTKRHITIGHSHVRNSLLIQYRKVVLAKSESEFLWTTYHSGSYAQAEGGTWKAGPE